MFERYTEKARRVIFFARYEAGQFGSPLIESEYILLGLLREDVGLRMRVPQWESIRKQISERSTLREKVLTTDLPMSTQAKRVLDYAAEEANRLRDKHIGTEHILLGLLREDACFAAEMLHERGLRLTLMREHFASVKDQAMFQLPEKDRDTQVHARAKQRGQRTFTLVEQDATAVETICDWITRNVHTAPREKLIDALETAIAMRSYMNVKRAD